MMTERADTSDPPSQPDEPGPGPGPGPETARERELRQEIIAITLTAAAWKADADRLRRKYGPTHDLVALKSIDPGRYDPETLRRWWHQGHIVAERRGGRLFSTVASVAQYIQALGRE
jgi:hypothetical protein